MIWWIKFLLLYYTHCYHSWSLIVLLFGENKLTLPIWRNFILVVKTKIKFRQIGKVNLQRYQQYTTAQFTTRIQWCCLNDCTSNQIPTQIANQLDVPNSLLVPPFFHSQKIVEFNSIKSHVVCYKFETNTTLYLTSSIFTVDASEGTWHGR